MNATILGGLILGLPLLLVGIYFLWRKWRTIFWMYFGALVLALGYLATTGALSDIGSVGEGIVFEGEAAPETAAPAPAADDASGATPAPATP